jgi:hypothetical protein
VDEPSVEAFTTKVECGIYPEPLRQEGCLSKWNREVMDYHVALRRGLNNEWPGAVKSSEHLI